MATLTGLAFVDMMEGKKTKADRWRELTTPPHDAVGVAAVGVGAFVLSDYGLAGALTGAVLLNFVLNSLRDDVPTVEDVVEAVGTVAARAPLSPAAPDLVGLTDAQVFEDAHTYHTRGTPQVGTRMIRPPL